jgi:RNA polymerase sigma factor (sigma-70 family)
MVCLTLSMATSTMGFTSTPFLPASRPLHLESQHTVAPSSPVALHMAVKSKSYNMASAVASRPRLTLEEETELLRLAAEDRRLRQLEADMAIGGHRLPLLSVRAKAAGYGTELEAYEDAMLDGHKAKNELVTRNMGLVHYCVTQILRSKRHLNSLSRDDLVQEGAIGLARAVDKFNPSIGGKFSTYSVYWIRAAVLRCIAERDDILRVPSHVSQAVLEINKASKRLGIDLDNAMASKSWKEAHQAKRLAEEAGLSDRNFEEAMKVRHRRYTGGYVAFDESWMQKGESLASDVPATGAVVESATASLEREHLRKTLSQFVRPQEMEALSWRYGLVNEVDNNLNTSPQQRANKFLAEAEEHLFGATASPTKSSTKTTKTKKASSESLTVKGRWGEAMSFNEVGKNMQVSAEYGRRLCHAGLAKLRQAAEDGRLQPALLY